MSIIVRSTPTAAHWYAPDGKACHEVPCKSRPGEMRPTTLADARKNGWLPSVSTILRVLDKPGLNVWKQEQAVLAALTTPQRDGETLDEFARRVVEEDAQQEAATARDLGTEIHDAMEKAVFQREYPEHLREYVEPALALLPPMTEAVTERTVVGNGYAGRCDLGYRKLGDPEWHLVDFKTTKSALPKKPWREHELQLSAYARAWPTRNDVATTSVLYISTTEPGQCVLLPCEAWLATFTLGFRPLYDVWRWMTGYTPPSFDTNKI